MTFGDLVLVMADSSAGAEGFAGLRVIASVGPVRTEALKRNGLPVDLEPAHPKLGSLLSETSRKDRAILQRKRNG